MKFLLIMKRKMLSAALKFFFISVLIMMPWFADCQDFEQPTDEEPADPRAAAEVPIDDGVWVLLSAGIAYGIYKSTQAKVKYATGSGQPGNDIDA